MVPSAETSDLTIPAVRVGFDGRALTSPASGVRRYVRELLSALPSVDEQINMVAIGAPDSATLPPRVTGVPASIRLPTNLGWMLVGVPFAARSAKLALYHAPAYTAPLWGVRPLVLTIHDVSYAVRAEWYPHPSGALRRVFYRASALRADLVITDSEFSRREIQGAYGVAPERIEVIPLGVAETFTPAPLPSAGELPERVRGPYVLHVGDLHRRRNLETALDAVVALRSRSKDLASLRLVLAGVDRGVGAALRSRAEEVGAPDGLILLGSVSEHTLLSLYRSANLLVYPSRYEGFGLPLLEAMACGLPVIASRSGAIPEVAGSAAILLDQDDVRGFAEAMERILLSAEHAAQLRAEGLHRAAQFTWRRTAEETARAYRRCVAEFERVNASR